jgi:hypothetical protein
VLRAYEFSCDLRGFDVRLGTKAAPWRLPISNGTRPADRTKNPTDWRSARCTINCSTAGVFTLSEKMKVIVSESANGTKGFQEWVIAFHGSSIRAPQRPNYPPSQKATGVNPWMNARWVPAVALAKVGALRPSPSEVGYGRRRSEGSALRSVWRGATAVRPWGSTFRTRSQLNGMSARFFKARTTRKS